MQNRSNGYRALSAALMALLAAGCGQMREAARSPAADTSSAGSEAKQVAGGPMGQSAPASPEASGKIKPASVSIQELAASRPDQYLIKNAQITVETADVPKALEHLIAGAKALQGYVSTMHESVDGLGARSVEVKLRVPYTQFDRSMQTVETLGKVLDRQVTAEDVTEDFVDTDAKARNLKRTEERLLAHLGRSGKLSDTLLVEKELTRVREQDEQLEGHLRYLGNRIAFSTIDVPLREKARPQAMVPPESYSTGKNVSDAVRALVGFGQSVWTALIWVGVWLPVWGIAALVVWALRRRNRASRPGTRSA